MVDSRSFHPESVIDLAERKRARGIATPSDTAPSDTEPSTVAPFIAAPAEEEPVGREGLGSFPLSLPFLMERLAEPSDQVTMWAAYQLVDRYPSDAPQYIERLWNSSLPEIRESAVHLVSQHRLHQYAFPLLRTFNAEEGELRASAGEALGYLRYEPAVRPLQDWFGWVLGSPEVSLLELESAAKSLLLLDNRRYWDELYRRLEGCRQNHSVFSVLFNTLALHAETADQTERIAQAYGPPREASHDFHLTQHLVEVFGRPNLCRYLQTRLNGGFSLVACYQEALAILGSDLSDPEVRLAVEGLGGCDKTGEGLERFIPAAINLIDRLAPDEPESAALKAFLQGCTGWLPQWEDAVLKVREVEFHLLVSLPLVAALCRAERECLDEPVRQAERIVRIYQSPLLSAPFMGLVLNLLTSQEGGAVMARLGAGPLSGWLRDDEKDALWKLITGQLDDVDYPFEQILPRPWEYRNPALTARLVEQLKARFGHYLESGRNQAVDYCLEVFRRHGSAELLELLLHHFDALIKYHYHGMVDVMNHLPDERFLQPLLRYHREGEDELERLIRFLCDVHRRPYPEGFQPAGEGSPPVTVPATVRLRCPACEGSFQYVLEALYVDEERIEQRQVPAPEHLWSPHPFACKNCGANVPLEPEEHFLNDLYSELLAARIFHLTNKEESALNHIHMIPFPMLNGRTRHPDHFLKEVHLAIATGREPGDEVPHLLELGRFYLEIGELALARDAFQRVNNGPSRCPQALYFLGVIAFQEKNPYEARVCFSRLVETCSREEFEEALDNPVDMAKHYLKLLEKREFKRAHFKILPS